mgnify:CR=1 FL=1
MLVAAMNPCPCGYFPDRNKCSCTPFQIRRYQQKISGPLLDRIDINMEVKPVRYDDIFTESEEENSDTIRARVEKVRWIQRQRYAEDNLSFNSQLEGKLIKKYIRLEDKVDVYFKDRLKKLELSARGIDRILKLSQTIADMAGSDKIREDHINEAIFYRNSGLFEYKEGR